MKADGQGLTMARRCIACGGSGLAEHVDRTLPPPPCRLCHAEEAALHMALAHETRTVATARRRDAYQMLRAAVVLHDRCARDCNPLRLYRANCSETIWVVYMPRILSVLCHLVQYLRRTRWMSACGDVAPRPTPE